ncbi:MAG: [protein-PII] uridylyltransferase [Acidothermus sp.]|nr:[protein-PII] uridylyltransferase [Acidothermus sp.]
MERAGRHRRPGTNGRTRRRSPVTDAFLDAVAALDTARGRRCVEVDAWLAGLLTDATAGNPVGLALVAVGGYGRRELGPGSDLDVVLLHEGRPDIAAVADKIWYPIWDAGRRLDHSVRTVAEALAMAARDLRVVLGLLHARAVGGDATLVTRLREQVLKAWRAEAKRRLPELRDSCLHRAERHGEVAFLLEPDLKEARGGLRDVDALDAIAAAWVATGPNAATRAAQRHLLAVRDALQEVTGRPTTRLVRQDQDAVAHRLGLPDAEALAGVVAAAGRTIAYASDVTWRSVEGALGRRPRTARRPLAGGVVEQGGEVVLARGVDPARDPGLVLRVAAAAAQAGLPLAPPTVAVLAEQCPPLPTPWRGSDRDAFLALLGAGPPSLPVFEALDQAGLLVRLIPEWEAVRFRRQRTPLHRFTVDRHLIETVIEASALTRRVARPDLLLVGAFLHDIGKGFEGDHSECGASVAEEICRRMGFTPDDAATVAAMVRLHLLLPRTAVRRDLGDPLTVADVAEHIASPQLLELLHALAEADGRATGVWDDWRARLIGELVERVGAHLAGSPPPPPEIEVSAAARAAAARGELQVLLTEEAGGPRLTLVAPDRPGLLWRAAGVLALHRLTIRGARATSVGPMAVTVFDVEPIYLADVDPDRIRDDLRRALDGSLDLPTLMARRAASAGSPHRRAPASVVLPRASQDATVFEIRAHDRPGLLFTIARLLADAGLDVRAAKVDTLGAEVVDVFYVTDTEGRPLSAQTAEEMRRVLEAGLH